jgi:Virulence-associated protein E/Primase C terminal 2 (PriCT-2)
MYTTSHKNRKSGNFFVEWPRPKPAAPPIPDNWDLFTAWLDANGYNGQPEESDIGTRKLWLTIFKDETGSEKFKGEHTLPEWQQLIQTATADEKKKLFWLKGLKFGDKLSTNNSYRTNENAEALTAVVVEHDKGTIAFDQALAIVEKANLRGIGYTSPSYQKVTKERWRFIFPLSKDNPPERHEILVAYVNGIFGGKLAPESFVLSQSYYFGSVNNPEHRVEVIDGQFLDLADRLFAGRMFKDGGKEEPKSKPRAERNNNPKTKWDDVNASARDPIDKEEAKAALDAISSDCKYAEWWPIGAALWNTLGDDGEKLFIEWSKKCPKRYNEKEVAAKWKQLKHDDNDHGAGKLFGRANHETPGWRDAWKKTTEANPAADAKFIKTTNGNVALTQSNIRLALKKLGVIVRYNLFEDRPTIEGLDGFDSLNDAAMDRLWLTIDQKFKFRPTKEFFWTVVFDEARLHPFHPVCEYLGGLKWNGVKRIDSWLIDYGSAEDTPYIRAIGALFLVAAVRRVRSPGCKFDEMIVLQSDQGLDKSSALAILAVHPEWFSDDLPLNADSKKTIERLRGRWIVEAAELKGMRHGDVEHLKAFLSRTVDRARMSYDRTTTELKRQCVICGTTNHDKFLRDMTGNRRFWPARGIKCDLAKLKQDRDQLWAEAAAREAEGVSIRLPKELWADAGAEQEEHAIEEPWVEIIRDHLGGLEGKLLCSDAWLLVEIPIGQRTQVHNERLGIAMRAAGWVRTKRRFGPQGKPQWCYVPEGMSYGQALKKVSVSTDGRQVTFIRLIHDEETKFR